MHAARSLLLPAFCLITISQAMAERYAGEFTVTAYCSCSECCGRGARGLTASGKAVRSGMIAADWGVLPRGTRVRLSAFPGHTFVVEDTGSAIVDNRIDIWFPSHLLARQFGLRRGVKVWVVPAPAAAAARTPPSSRPQGLARAGTRARCW
jgi:3D (Asp-Asp-Asp) domain-containing protein